MERPRWLGPWKRAKGRAEDPEIRDRIIRHPAGYPVLDRIAANREQRRISLQNVKRYGVLRDPDNGGTIE